MIDPDAIVSVALPDVSEEITLRDMRIYALGIGIGDQPDADDEVAFHLNPQMPAFPTMAAVICHPRDRLKGLLPGIDWTGIVQGEQSLDLFAELPPQATYRSQSRVLEILDKGEGKGAVLRFERTLWCTASDKPVARAQNAIFARGAGGFGGTRETSFPQPACPDRGADHFIDIPTHLNLALIHRLSGDLNPLHADPGHAAKAGFPRPILHGLATYGLAARGVLRAASAVPGALTHFSVRFARPFFPGETLRVHLWDLQDGGYAFRAEALERQQIVLDNGRATLSPAGPVSI